jgi:membrane-bound lytic murein transglycosylase B
VTARRWTSRVPAGLVLSLALVVATSASATLVQRGASSAPAGTPATISSATTGADLVRFTPGELPAPALPPAGSSVEVSAPEPDEVPEPEPEPEPAPPEPELAVVDERATQRPGDVQGRMIASPLPMLDRDELAATAARVGIPERALAAYASAALRLREEQPSCNLTWVTLAGVGYVESHHGTIGGRQLLPDGTVSKPIIGIPLDGGPNVRAIRDTDGGRYDGDPVWDRAVGPMQFIPSTWARWGADGSGDGEADPQHVDDAALAAARYLCASGGDLTASSSWGRAMYSYNRSEQYIRQVLSVANTYAERANAG